MRGTEAFASLKKEMEKGPLYVCLACRMCTRTVLLSIKIKYSTTPEDRLYKLKLSSYMYTLEREKTNR